jgi:HK97 family phage major capsid protein
MPAEKTVQEIATEIGSAFEEFKKVNDQRIKEESERNGKASAETTAKLAKVEKEMDEWRERLQKAETRLDRPGNPHAANDDAEPVEDRAHREAFINFLRFGRTHPEVKDNLQRACVAAVAAFRTRNADFISKASGTAQIDTLTPADGGYGVPKVISDQITHKLLDISPFREYCKVVQVGTTDYHELVDKRGETYGWVGETGVRSQTRTPALADCKPPIGMLYAYPQCTEESLQDIFFDVQAWLVGNCTNAFAQGEGIAFVTGSGANQPLGFLAATANIPDGWPSPPRADFTVQYLPSGAAGAFPAMPNSGDPLLDLQYALKPAYRMDAKWAMAKATISTVRKFKDTTGNYIWSPGLSPGAPSLLLGHDVIEAEAMPGIGANSLSIAFADWEEAYLIVDRVGMRLTVDEITTPGFVKFYLRKRVGGKVLNSDAIKVMKMAVS